jgi:hypothetical protein
MNKVKIAIATGTVAVLTAGGYLGSDLLKEDQVDISKMKEVKMIETQVGEEYILIYKNNSTDDVSEFKVTKEQYEDVSLRNQQPPKKGYTFMGGYGGVPVITTSTPTLKEGEYFVISPKGTTTPEIIKYIKDNKEVILEK